MALTHEDYKVAWICALPLEMTAAKTMLDESHPPLSQRQSDHNIYTLGSVSGHNVVIACLPSGVYGTTSAAVVLAQMLLTFPSLLFGLMVGIGGGVPSKTDIRLGDVVVSMPTATAGGVVQYDYGKTLSGGFLPTGSLNKPPQYLLTAISHMRSEDMFRETIIEKTILEILRKHKKLRKQFSRPETDWLFSPTYDHEEGNIDCSGCDLDQLIYRTPRESNEPVVHYGLIASGNQVMKDARTRDSIAQEHGILCFEMEAAGLMDQLPCLVIRGICDYCDSHKHKQWQGYAALTAATYTRDLLESIPLHNHGHSEVSKHGQSEGRKKPRHWMVPFFRNPQFIGRQHEIDALKELIIHTQGPTKVALYGLGGIGKTQIALEVAYHVREKSPECSIFWIPCTSYESVEQAYLGIASSLGITVGDPARVKEQVKAHLSQESAIRWLLIFDNADDMDLWVTGSATVTPLKNIVPQNENGRILFTTRNRKLAVKLAPKVLSIPDIDQSTATNILGKLLVQGGLLEDDSITFSLLEQLSFLPLAISQAAAYINANGIKICDYLSLLKEQEASAIELLSEEFTDEGRYSEIQNPVATTWLISFQQIQELNRLAADYLAFMACINPRDIPQSILPSAASAKEMVDALGLLSAYSFISEHACNSSFSLHRLVHLAMRNWMRKTDMFNIWVQKTARQLDRIFPSDDHENRALWREYLPHATHFINSEEFWVLRDQYTSFTIRVGRCLQSEGRYYEAEQILRDVLEIFEHAVGPDHPNTLIGLGTLGSVLLNQGKYKEAEVMHRQELLGFEKLLGPDHPDTLTSMSRLGSALQKQGRYKEAEAMHRQELLGFEKVLGQDHPKTLISMSKLGSVLRKQGKYEEAEVMHRQELLAFEKVLGPDHPDTLTSMSRLGLVLQKQGRYKEAEVIHRQELLGFEKVLGRDHPKTLIGIGNLGSVLWKKGEYKEAEVMKQRVLEGNKRILGPDHPETLLSMSKLGSVLRQQGKYEEAEVIHRQELLGFEKLLGPDHPDTLTSMSKLGSVLRKKGEYKEAEVMKQRVLEGNKRILGPDHPETLLSMNNLANSWKLLGKEQAALALMGECVELCHKTLGPSHPRTKSSSRTLKKWQDMHVSLSDEQHQSIQAGSNQPPGRASVSSPVIVATNRTRPKTRYAASKERSTGNVCTNGS